MRLHHLALKAKDPEALARFYSEVLGLEEQVRHADDRGLRSVWLRLEQGVLMIERSDTEQDARPEPTFAGDPPGLHLLAFAIAPEDAPRWRRTVRVVAETAFTLYFFDPEQNRVGLSSHPEPLAR